MKNFLVLFREPDGRRDVHSDEDNRQHQISWQNWMAPLMKNGKLAGGQALTLKGKMISHEGIVSDGINYSGTEIVGGYLLIKSNDLEGAAATMKGCPVFDRGASAEVRELMQ